MKLKNKAVSDKIGKDIPYPFYATAGAAAMDLCACVDAPVEVAPRALVSIPTGIAIALPSAEYDTRLMIQTAGITGVNLIRHKKIFIIV